MRAVNIEAPGEWDSKIITSCRIICYYFMQPHLHSKTDTDLGKPFKEEL